MKNKALVLLILSCGCIKINASFSFWETWEKSWGHVERQGDIFGTAIAKLMTAKHDFICLKKKLSKGDTFDIQSIDKNEIIGIYKDQPMASGKKALEACQKMVELLPHEKAYNGPLSIVKATNGKVLQVGRTLKRKDYYCIKADAGKKGKKITSQQVSNFFNEGKVLQAVGPYKKGIKALSKCEKLAAEELYSGPLTVVRIKDGKVSAQGIAQTSDLEKIEFDYSCIKDDCGDVGSMITKEQIENFKTNKKVAVSSFKGTLKEIEQKCKSSMKAAASIGRKYDGVLSIIRDKDLRVIKKFNFPEN